VLSASPDRLRVFVSSTIKECAEERAVIRDAIKSINHDPVLFEDIGARPHPPRELYTARLEESQIFVGVYRESYGWIASDMDVSGVEDEFRIATRRGMDRLVYVYESPTHRDAKLDSLLKVAERSGITFALYGRPDQLRDMVRNDITAVVSSRFIDQAIVSREAPTPAELLDSLLPNPDHRLRRPTVERNLLQALRDAGRLLVTAPLGGGKTVLLAQLAAENGWVFVDGQGLGRLDLLARVVNAVRERLQRRPVTFTNEQSATQELLRLWEELGTATLAVDGAGDPALIWQLPARECHLLLSTRAPHEVPVKQRFPIPALTEQEIQEWVTALRGRQPDPGELVTLVARSAGNPLYLRFYALGTVAADLSLQELEIRAAQDLPARAREITSYLTLSIRPLSLADLHQLVGPEESPENVVEHLAAASGFIRDTRGLAQLAHEHLKGTLLDQLRQAPARLAFFGNRLGGHFERLQRYIAAFHAYAQAGELRHADRILASAANEAALMGGGGPAIPIFRRQVDLARDRDNAEEEVHALASLAFALEQTGAREDATRSLADARLVAEGEKSEALLLRVREMEVVVDVHNSLREARVGALLAIRQAHADRGDTFNASRVGTLVTAEYIATGQYREAEQSSRSALDGFISLGDDYGIRVARLNLAAALSGIPGREDESISIAQELQQDLDPEDHPRERAVLCNVLTRHYREQGNPTRAAEFALEAVEIGERLGDQRVVAINRMNLGNARRDQGALDQALEAYRTADQAAVAGGVREVEAAANELIASVLNQRNEYGLALQHALHASTVAHAIADNVLIARSEEERAIALEGQRDVKAAVEAYGEAAKAIAVVRPGGSFFVSLLGDGLNLCATSGQINLKIDLLGGGLCA
jgi:tetratricopeptide (TPR) repeat protein